MVEANWSGEWPHLCCGKWTLVVDGKDVSDKIPEDLRSSPMNTYGSWHFDCGQAEPVSYNDGLMCEEWIKENKEWLNKISGDSGTQREIFETISKHDFREGSCGGCR